MKQMTGKALSLLLTLAMLLSLLTVPAGAVSAKGTTGSVTTISGDYTISSGGEYRLAPGASGTITIASGVTNVTIVGNGAVWVSDESSSDFGKIKSTPNEGIYIDCKGSGVTLTLKDLYISNDGPQKNTINYTGKGNTLIFDGTVIIDHNGNAQGYAAIHAGNGTSLTVYGTTGSRAYLYKREQGAGIGGDHKEACGALSFGQKNGANNFYIFMKGSKQGAVIGNGADCTGAPGSITFYSGVYNLLAYARGALIGGSAGVAAKSAGEVYINGGLLNLNVNYSGAAIGGGGYDTGNDKPGGTVYMNGGSVRAYVDENAITGGSTNLWAKQGVTCAGVNDAVITAEKVNSSGEPVYVLAVPIGNASSNTVKVDGGVYYTGPGYEWCFLNETRTHDNEIKIEGTPSNWISLTSETNLYVYATGKNHSVEVNGKLYMAVWNASTSSFTLTGHTHSYDWDYNANRHWKECECGSIVQSGAHTFGDWVIDHEATTAQLGEKHRDCECGYQETKTFSLSEYTLTISDGISGAAEVKDGETVTMYVTVEGAAFNGVEATVTYDPDLFRLKRATGDAVYSTSTDGTVELYTLSNAGYADGAQIAELRFTAINQGEEEQTGSFSFAVGATVGDYSDFRGDDALAADTSGDSVVVQPADRTYHVTLGTGLSGAETAQKEKAYTGTIDEYDPVVYAYTVRYQVTGGSSGTITEFDKNGGFTIPASAVTGAISVTLSKTVRYYTVTLPEDDDGLYTVTALGRTTDIRGREKFSFEIKVKDGYKIDSVQANGVEVAPDEDGVYTITVIADTEITVKVSKKQLGGDPEAEVWDGETIDIRWFTDDPKASRFYITYPAELAGLAALVNGIYNEDILYVWGDESYIVDMSGSGGSEGAGNNESTDDYHYGAYDFNGKTIYLCADIDMGEDNNYMPIGGQYLMTDEDTSTKISSSFCGMLDGQGHNVTIYCDRHCSGNYGDGQSVGLIGRLGVHDSDPASWRPSGAGVCNLAVYGSVRGNRSVGGIVGKIGKTVGGVTIECCANYASVSGTDAKGTGGIVGAAWNGGTIKNCYNSGKVTSTFTNAVAGIAGSCEIELINCYNVGSVVAPRTQTAAIASNNGGSSFTNCYWLTGSADVGVYGSSKGFEEKSSSYMRTAEFVSVLGKAFVMDTGNINDGYPVFEWQAGNSASAIIESTTTVKNGVATTTVTEKAVSASVAAAEKGKFDTLYIITDTNGKSADETQVEISRDSVAEIAQAELSLCVETADGTQLTLGADALEKMADLAKKSSIVITVTPRTQSEMKTLLGKTDGYEDTGLDGSAAVTVSVTSGGSELSGFTAKLSIQFPVSDEDFQKGESYEMLRVLSDGTVSTLSGTCISVGGELYISFKTTGTGTFIALQKVNKGISYDDVHEGDWFYDAVMYASQQGLMDGIGNNLFDPDGSMTRAMLVTVLYRLEGEPAVSGGSKFADVKSGQWYTNAVIWGTENGIVKGYDTGLFGTEDYVTREQIAAIMYRYAAYKGYSTTGMASLAKYGDASQIGSWALNAMQWACAKGLLTGRPGDLLAPQGTASRAEVATILMRFCEKFVVE